LRYATLLGPRILKRLPNFCKVCAPMLLNSALDGGEWSASRPGRFSRGSDVSVYPLKMGLGMLQSKFVSFEEEKNSTRW
jgi:hypothetical protein